MLPLRATVDLGSMAMKEYSAFPKAPAVLEHHHQIIVSYPGHSMGFFYSSAEMQSVYSIAPADWAKVSVCKSLVLYRNIRNVLLCVNN